MSPLLKNSLLAFALICVIALVVFCIQLIIINIGEERVTQGEIIVVEPERDEEHLNDNDIDDIEDDHSDEENAFGFEDFWRPPQIGERYVIQVTPNSQLVVYAQDVLFEFEDRDIDWAFNYMLGGTAALEIMFKLVTVQGVESQSVAFLNEYSGSQASTFNGEVAITGTRLMGYHTSVNHLARTYEAWIINLLDSELSLVIIVHYETDAQRDALYQLLGTIDIEALGTEPPEMPEPDVNESEDYESLDYPYEEADGEEG